MAKGLIGKKLGMTQVFSPEGEMVPVTVIEAGPCLVTEVRTEEKDGYNALQLAFDKVKPAKLNKPERGIFDKLNAEPRKHLREFRDFDGDEYQPGDEINLEIFSEGELVNISGVSKGKGFSGNVERHNHATGPKTHGSRMYRAPGSIGSTDAARVFKGQELPGRMGHDQVKIKNLEIVSLRPDDNVILIKGSVPGPKKSILTIELSQ